MAKIFFDPATQAYCEVSDDNFIKAKASILAAKGKSGNTVVFDPGSIVYRERSAAWILEAITKNKF